jgi:arylsulfatase A-like enzyme
LQCKQKPVRVLSRRKVLKYGLYGSVAAGLAPSLWLSGCGKLQQGKKPNIILIVIDTLRFDHLGCYGYKRNTTPNIDSLANQSLLFKNAIITAPWTLPSVASILTSQYPSVLGIHDRIRPMDGRFPLFSELLKQYNYKTHGIISHTLLLARLGFGKGFDYYDEESIFGHKGISSPSVTSKAVSYLQQNHDKPFFLFLHYFDPHYDYLLHKKYNYYPSYRGRVKSGHSIIDLWRIRDNLSKDDIKYLVSLYDSEITFTDEYIGELLNELRNRGLYDNSIIIITSDHGEEFMERGWIGHTLTLHQELVHVPLIMKFPGDKSRIIDSPVSLIDIVPTICKYLDLKIPNNLDGRVLDLSRGSTIKSGPIFSETFNPQIHRPKVTPIAFRSVILGNQKLIRDEIKNSKQVYNLSDDPHERDNLSGQHSEQNKRLEALLSKWISYVKTKHKTGPSQDESELFTPEQRKQLESLGYL